MIIKKCDVCKNETDTLYDKEMVTHIDIVNGKEVYKKEKLHICRTCIGSFKDTIDKSELGWYEDNVKEASDDVVDNIDNNEPNGDSGQNSEDAGGTETGD